MEENAGSDGRNLITWEVREGEKREKVLEGATLNAGERWIVTTS